MMENIIKHVTEQLFDRACEGAIDYGFNSNRIQAIAFKYNISYHEARDIVQNTTQSVVNDIRELQNKVESQ